MRGENPEGSVFFCAIGGSGMLPLAMVMKARGFDVRGSDRSRDQGRTPERFAFIQDQGIALFAQDGQGVTPQVSRLIVSSAVEETVPDWQAALKLGIPVIKRAALLADLFNEAKTGLAVAGTSGKSTTTGMIGWILCQAGLNPTVVNGAVMKNFATEALPFASACVGDPDLFVSEVDESDGSIALFDPTLAVLNNIALDHKSLPELRTLFGAFAGKAERVVLNLDNPETAALVGRKESAAQEVTYSLKDPRATLLACDLTFTASGAAFNVRVNNDRSGWASAQTDLLVPVKLQVPGHHNVSNALAAIGAALAQGVDVRQAAAALASFTGIRRRLEVVGTTPQGVTVIDDFAHNPDKIAASLRTLHQTPGRTLVVFQPHGYGPLRLMRKELAQAFAQGLSQEDRLFVADALYLGGTTQRNVTSQDLAQDIASLGRQAIYKALREDALAAVIDMARAGDKIVVMGARDDTLSALAKKAWQTLNALARPDSSKAER